MKSKPITLSLSETDIHIVLLALDMRRLAYLDVANRSETLLNRAFAWKYGRLSDHIRAQLEEQGGRSYETFHE